jgi:hypothetical protein
MKTKLLAPLFVLVSLAIYGSALQYDFVEIDDGGQVLQNPFLDSLSWSNLVGMFSSATVGMYQPLTTFLFALLSQLFGREAATPFHMLSLGLHVGNTILVWTLGKRLFQQAPLALVLALLFAVHPLAVEVVCWVSATSTLLFTSFFLIGMLTYERYLAEARPKHYVGTLLAFTLGCFAKVQMLPFVGVLFLLDVLREEQWIVRKRLVQKLPFVLIAAIFSFVSLRFRGGQSGFIGDYAPQLLTPGQITWYIWKAFVPLKLGIVYDWPTSPLNAWTIGSWLALPGLVWGIWRLRANKLVVFGGLFFLGNIILHTAVATTFLGPVADRYGYLSLLGVWVAILGLLPKAKPAPNLLPIAALPLLILAGLSYAQTRHWQSTIALWTNNLEHQESTFSNGMRGALYYQRGQFPRAKQDFERFDAQPDPRFEPEKYSYLYTALGVMTTDAEPENSLRYFKLAAKWLPKPEAFENVAIAAKKLGQFGEAEEHYLACLEANPSLSHYTNLSSLYFESQQFSKGEAIMTEAIEAGLTDILLYKMRCFFRLQTGDIAGAQQDFERAMTLYNQESQAAPDPILESLQVQLLTVLKAQ